MPPEKPSSSFIRVDDLLHNVSVEQAARFYGATLPELKRVGDEIRARCFLNCGKTAETGDRALAIREDDLAKRWHCHQYGCGKGGNIIGLCDLLKPGEHMGGKPRGERFKQIAADLQAIVNGVSSAPSLRSPVSEPKSAKSAPPKVNMALARSNNERARALIDLDAKFVTDIARMPQTASLYFRRRPFLSAEACQEFRVGYLPRDAGGDRAGGTMRGRIVYGYHSEDGELLTWFGRDPDFEAKHWQWANSDRSGPEPEKYHFVKGFHRGLELYGQDRLKAADVPDKLAGLGLIVAEGPNDAIRLATLGVPAVALCSNMITREQAEKAARLACAVGSGIVTIFLDCDPEGEQGMKQALGYLAQFAPVRLAWTGKMHNGQFQGRQPESLKLEEWDRIAAFLRGQIAT